jgi:hypothetical protein
MSQRTWRQRERWVGLIHVGAPPQRCLSVSVVAVRHLSCSVCSRRRHQRHQRHPRLWCRRLRLRRRGRLISSSSSARSTCSSASHTRWRLRLQLHLRSDRRRMLRWRRRLLSSPLLVIPVALLHLRIHRHRIVIPQRRQVMVRVRVIRQLRPH